MYYQDHKQLSLIAEGVAGHPLGDDVEYDYCDWSIDTAPSMELLISIESVSVAGDPRRMIIILTPI